MYVSVTIKMPIELLQMIDELIERGDFKTRGEIIRAAVEEFVYKRILFPDMKFNDTVKGAVGEV